MQTIHREGVPGHFALIKSGAFIRIRHAVPQDDSYPPYYTLHHVGTVPRGVYGGNDVAAKGNKRAGEQIQELIDDYVTK